MLTLRPAFDDKDRLRLVKRVSAGQPDPPRRLDPRIPRDLETVVLKAMARDPADRYQSAADLADDLGRFLADRPVGARRRSLAEQTLRWCRRNPALSGLAACVGTLLLVLAIGATAAAELLRRERDAALGQRTRAELAEREKSQELFEAHLARARAGRWSGRPGRRIDGLRALAEAAALGRELRLPPERMREVRNEVIACLALIDVRQGPWTAHATWSWAVPRLRPDRERTLPVPAKTRRYPCAARPTAARQPA